MANGKIRDSPRRRDPCLKIRDRDVKVLTKSEPETSFCQNSSRYSKTVRSETWATRYSKINKCNQVISVACSVNLLLYGRSISQEFQNFTPWQLIFDLKTRSCRAYIFERLLSYVFNQINNFIVRFDRNPWQQTKIRDSETSQPKIRESETQRNTRKRDFETHWKLLRDFEIGTKISETLNFPGTVRHPLFYYSFSAQERVCCISCALAQFRLRRKGTNWDANIFSVEILKLCLQNGIENTENLYMVLRPTILVLFSLNMIHLII